MGIFIGIFGGPRMGVEAGIGEADGVQRGREDNNGILISPRALLDNTPLRP
jgi:hypothetical protein